MTSNTLMEKVLWDKKQGTMNRDTKMIRRSSNFPRKYVISLLVASGEMILNIGHGFLQSLFIWIDRHVERREQRSIPEWNKEIKRTNRIFRVPEVAFVTPWMVIVTPWMVILLVTLPKVMLIVAPTFLEIIA